MLGAAVRSSGASTLAWIYFGYVVAASIFADAFDLPGWFSAASPLTYTASVPLEDVDPPALFVLLVVSAGVATSGLLGFRRRDSGC